MSKIYSPLPFWVVAWWVGVTCMLLFSFAAQPCGAFYIPGLSETSHAPKDSISFLVNALRSSFVTFPIDYTTLPFCGIENPKLKTETIGEVLWGDRLYDSLYQTEMLVESRCRLLKPCNAAKNKADMKDKAEWVTKLINQWYRVHMSVDNLPVFSDAKASGRYEKCTTHLKNSALQKQSGFLLGVPKGCGEETLLNNHVSFTIFYNNASSVENEVPKYIIVGFNAAPKSINWVNESDCNEETNLSSWEDNVLSMNSITESNSTFYLTYSIHWVYRDDVKWATRWDAYLNNVANGAKANHIITGFIALLLASVAASSVFYIFIRTLRKDFNRYNSGDPEELLEETGWKLVHADVFRPPHRAELLAALAGNGYQLISTSALILIVALLGYLSPSRRGSLLTALIFTVVATSIIGGFVCGFLQQYLNCRAWKNVFLCCATLPGVMCASYLFIWVINVAHGATTAVPFSTVMLLILLVLMVCVPLMILGASFAYHREPMANPVSVGRLAREIPKQMWFNEPGLLYTFWPLFPLCIVLMEFYYIMQDLWTGQTYYAFGFVTLVAIVWMLVCSLTTIINLYYILCSENHQWWWSAFIVPGGMGVHLFLFTVYFFFTQLEISTPASAICYFIYMGLMSYIYGLAAGAIGLSSGILFVRIIYASIKID